eukprot:5114831-Prymnesium_polylepis.1
MVETEQMCDAIKDEVRQGRRGGRRENRGEARGAGSAWVWVHAARAAPQCHAAPTPRAPLIAPPPPLSFSPQVWPEPLKYYFAFTRGNGGAGE